MDPGIDALSLALCTDNVKLLELNTVGMTPSLRLKSVFVDILIMDV